VENFSGERKSGTFDESSSCNASWVEIHKKKIVFDGEECDMFVARDQSDHEKLGEARKLATTNAHVSSDMRKPIEKILDVSTNMQ